MKTKKRIISLFLCLAMLGTALLNFAGCVTKVRAADLMKGIDANTVTGRTADGDFIGSSADFAVKLFSKTATDGENSLISPLSVMLALAMTANGADNMTRAQMEALLGGDIPLETLNEYLYGYINSLPSGDGAKLNIANSIWFRDDADRLTVKKDFLQANADYYGAEAYKSAFDGETLLNINNWVKRNTDGMIDKILDEISDDAVMYLINALVFDAKWEEVYNKNDIYTGTFTSADGAKQQAEFMCSSEHAFISDGSATGFIKNYKGGAYGFVALLPNEDVDINEYVSSMTGESFLGIVRNMKTVSVNAQLPKFSYEYKTVMNEQLKALGMPDAFSSDTADFSRLGRSSYGNIRISEVLHKTFISVDELGTKAGAVTKVEMVDESATVGYTVRLDRPFIYAIIDNSTGLPVFMGTVMSVD